MKNIFPMGIKRIIVVSLKALILLVACSPSQADLDATATKVMADEFAEQTAEAPTPTQVPTDTQTPTDTPNPTPTITKTPRPTLTSKPTIQVASSPSFPDPFDDNRNGWGLDEVVKIQNGTLQFRNIPINKSWLTYCESCVVTADHNTVAVEGTFRGDWDRGIGLVLENGSCSPDALVFGIWPEGYYRILQRVGKDNTEDFKHWRPFIDWTGSRYIKQKKDSTNVLSAEYEFGDDLRITLYVNDKYLTRLRVYSYDGSDECGSGLFVGGAIDVDFDNFSIE